mmetsp:Transcript_20903/g.58394  ORF Transcript_20903/g.58394 Transcript_20903/m.58394 type:complete len:290 (-) Transcript_20903:1583-2452(-)
MVVHGCAARAEVAGLSSSRSSTSFNSTAPRLWPQPHPVTFFRDCALLSLVWPPSTAAPRQLRRRPPSRAAPRAWATRRVPPRPRTQTPPRERSSWSRSSVGFSSSRSRRPTSSGAAAAPPFRSLPRRWRTFLWRRVPSPMQLGVARLTRCCCSLASPATRRCSNMGRLAAAKTPETRGSGTSRLSCCGTARRSWPRHLRRPPRPRFQLPPRLLMGRFRPYRLRPPLIRPELFCRLSVHCRFAAARRLSSSWVTSWNGWRSSSTTWPTSAALPLRPLRTRWSDQLPWPSN